MSEGTVPVRPGEGFDVGRAMEYLRAHVPGIPPGEVEVRQFPTGASNLTYLLRVDGWQAVLRRPPAGPVAPRAHDMVREGELLLRLHPVYPLAPRPLVVCADASVIGAPFHLAEYRRGVVVDAGLPGGVEADAARLRAVAEAAVRTLAALHRVDAAAAGLAEMGRPEGFLARQVEGWIGRYERARTDDVPHPASLFARLRASTPPDGETTVIHNDFKLNNLLFDPGDLSTVTAVLDWEMATVGDPLLDFAVFLGYWVDADDPPELRALIPSVTTLPAAPRRDELRSIYARASGRDLAGLDWYLTFARVKLAVILQQIYARWVGGQTRDPRFAGFGRAVRLLLAHAERLATP